MSSDSDAAFDSYKELVAKALAEKQRSQQKEIGAGGLGSSQRGGSSMGGYDASFMFALNKKMDEAERLFVSRKFGACFDKCTGVLDELVTMYGLYHRSGLKKAYQPTSHRLYGRFTLDADPLDDVEADTTLLPRNHQCLSPCVCVACFTLALQCLCELGRLEKVVPFIQQHYGSVSLLPYNSFLLYVNILLAQGDFKAAKECVLQYLFTHKRREEKSKVTAHKEQQAKLLEAIYDEEDEAAGVHAQRERQEHKKKEKEDASAPRDTPYSQLTIDQYDGLIEIMVFHIYCRQWEASSASKPESRETQRKQLLLEAKAFLIENSKVSPWRKRAFVKRLIELEEQVEVVSATRVDLLSDEDASDGELPEEEEGVAPHTAVVPSSSSSSFSSSSSSSSPSSIGQLLTHVRQQWRFLVLLYVVFRFSILRNSALWTWLRDLRVVQWAKAELVALIAKSAYGRLLAHPPVP
jgi:hypothetical protein